MIEKNIICCYYSTEVELCGHPSIHIPKLLIMVKYFPKNHSLTLLSHLASQMDFYNKIISFLIFFVGINMLKYSSLLALSIPLILCNKVFNSTEDFTLAQRFINCSIHIKILKKH